jgi:hypothetical protein
VVLLLELTHHADALMVPILIAVVEATVLARVLGAPSIYSARLSATATEVHAAAARSSGGEADVKTAEEEMLAPSDLLPITMHRPNR